MPPDPPEKWRTVADAISDKNKTFRLCLIIAVNALSMGLVLTCLIFAAKMVGL